MSGLPESEYIFKVSGEDYSLPEREFRALLETDGNEVKITYLGNCTYRVTGNIDANAIVDRAAYVRVGGILVGHADLGTLRVKSFDEGAFDSRRSFAVRIWNGGQRLDYAKTVSRLGEYVRRKTGCPVNLDEPGQTVHVIAHGSSLLLVHANWSLTTERKWKDRRPRAREFFHPSAIFPKLARCLVNLARVKKTQTFLDPFCGTGSLLIEAGLTGLRVLGSDISRKMVCGSVSNLKKFGVEYEAVIEADIWHHPLNRVDGIACDIPYGRCSKVFGRESSAVLGQLLDTIADVLPGGQYGVIMHTSKEEVPTTYGPLKKVSQDEIRVHRTLTRRVTVVQRC